MYVKFSTTEEAQRAYAALNRRWFAGSMIEIEYIPVPAYDNKFSLASA